MATRELTFDVIGRGRANLEQVARQLDKVGREVDELNGKSASPTVELDGAAQAIAEAERVDGALDSIDGRTARAQVKVDVDKESLSVLGMLGRGGAGLASGLVSGGIAAAGLAANLARAGALSGGLAVAGAGASAAFGAAATAVATLPPLLTATAAAGGSVALGLDGIERAAKTIKPEFEALQKSVSATWERGLNPAMADLAKTFPTIEAGSNRIAESLSRGAQSAAQFVSEGRGLELVETIFTNTAAATDKALPGLGKMGTSLLEVAARAPGLNSLATAANEVGTALEESVIDTIESGALDRATSFLGGTVGNLGELFVGLTQSGIELYSRAGPGVNKFLDSVGGFLGRFNWERLGGSVGRVFSGLGETLDGVPPETITGIEDAFGRLSDLFADPDFQGDLQSMLGAIPEFIDGLKTALDIGADIGGFVAGIVSQIGGENLVWGAAGIAAAAALWKGLKGAAKLWKGADLLTDLFGRGKKKFDPPFEVKDLFKRGFKWADILPDLASEGIDLLGDLLSDWLTSDPELEPDWDKITEGFTDSLTEAFQTALDEIKDSGELELTITADDEQLRTLLEGLRSGDPILIPLDADTALFDEALAGLTADPVRVPVEFVIPDLASLLPEPPTIRVQIEWVIPPLELPVPPTLRIPVEIVPPPGGFTIPAPPPVRVPIEPDDSGLLEWLDNFNLFQWGDSFKIPLVPDDGPLREFLNGLSSLIPAAIRVPITADDTQFQATLASLSTAVPPTITVQIQANNAAALAAVNAVRAAILALNSLSTTSRHTVVDNTAAALARILGLNGQDTNSLHTVADNVAAVLAAILGLNGQDTNSQHEVTHNVPSVLAALDSLNGHDTNSTHTVTTVYKSVNQSVLSGGGVIGYARGGIVPGYSPGRDTVPAMLSPGEAVLVPELVKMLGAKTILKLNRWASGRPGTTVGALGALGGDGTAMPTFGADRAAPRASGPRASGGTERVIERKLDELITLLRTRDGVVINVPGSPAGDPAENAQAMKLAVRTM